MAIVKWIQFSTPQANTTESSKPEPIPAVSSADAKKFGFENFGNTCYANSVLQALYFCNPFRELLLQSVDNPTPQNTLGSLHIPHPPPPSSTAAAWPKPPRKYSAAGLTSDAPSTNGTSQQPYPPIPSSSPTLVSALRSLFLYISKHPEDKGVVAPRAFIDKLKEVNELFRSTMHQDAHEFLNYLLNKVVEEIEEERKQQFGGTPLTEDLSNSIMSLASRPTTLTSNLGISPHEATLVHKLFEGILTSETRCLTCENLSSRDESFLDLSIDIEQNSSVTACLRQFSASEMLCQKNKFFCDSCCDLQEAEKRMKIKKLPNILALHLKRFKYQEDVQRYTKLTYRVAFPFELRLFNTVDDTEDADRLYELFAIVVHIGNGPHHGHYVSLVKTRGSWLVFDDDVVEAVKEGDIPRYFGDSNAGSAYVLYYQAVDIDLVGLGLRERAPTPMDKLPQQVSSPQSSPLLSAPAFPPGLAEEGDSSDISEPLPPPPAPVAVPHQPSISAPETQLGKAPPLRTNGAYLDNTSNPITSPTTTSPGLSSTSTIGGLFHSLRRGPTAKPRTGNAEGRKSYTEPSPKVVIQQPSLPSSEDHAKVETTSPPPVPSVNGKEKQPERKASTWFKRKGAKMRPESGSEHTPPSHATPPVDGHTPSQTGYHISLQAPGPPPLDLPLTRGGVSLPISAPGTFGLGMSPDGTRDRRNGYDSPSAGSVSSSFASTSAMQVHSEFSTNPYAPPMASAMSRSSQSPSPTGMRFPKQQNKSVTHLAHKGKKSFDAQESETTRLPRRPLSASDGYRNSPLIPPVPQLPLQTSSSPGTGERSETRLASRRDRERHVDLGKKRSESSSSGPAADRQPVEAGGSFSLPMPMPMPNQNSATANSASGAGLMRVSRKLSLSAPMLGFGRKDKDKDKQKDKEKDRDKTLAPQLSPFTSLSMTPRV